LGELHCVPRDVAATVPIEDRNDGRMRELRGEPRLAPKTSDHPLIAGDVRMEELERNLATQCEISYAPHRAERYCAERREHFIVVGKGPAKLHFGRLGRVRCSRLIAGEHDHGATSDDSVD